MLVKDTQDRLAKAIGDENLADEISARLIDYAPISSAEAIAILDILDTSDETNQKIEGVLGKGFKGLQISTSESVGHNINVCVRALQAKAQGIDLAKIKSEISEDWMGTDTLHYLGILLSSVEAAKDFESAYYRMIEMVKRM